MASSISKPETVTADLEYLLSYASSKIRVKLEEIQLPGLGNYCLKYALGCIAKKHHGLRLRVFAIFELLDGTDILYSQGRSNEIKVLPCHNVISYINNLTFLDQDVWFCRLSL